MKAISSVIAVLLMLIITIALAGLSYSYLSGVFTSKVATSFSIIDSYNDTVYIRNDGTNPINSIVATLDGGDVNIAVVPSISGLVGYWSFNEEPTVPPEITTPDNSGNGHTGTLYGTINWRSGNNCKFGNCLYFDGAGSYVSIDNHNALKPAQITTLVWAKMTAGDTILSKSYPKYTMICSASYFGGRVRINPTPPACAAEYYQICSVDYPVDCRNKWHFFGMTYDGNDLKLYIDGNLVKTENLPGTIDWDNEDLWFTRNTWSGGATSTGTIDEISFYNKALTESEIKSLASGLVGPGQTATVKVLPSEDLTKGNHVLRICTPSMCNTAQLSIN